MVMTEMMLRLIKDGKIVGYINIDEDGIGQSEDSLTHFSGYCSHITAISYNSFEQGIKVGDEWWFEGDKIQFKTFEAEIKNSWDERVLKHNGVGFYFNMADYWNPYLPIDIWEMKRIGNIHEEGKDE